MLAEVIGEGPAIKLALTFNYGDQEYTPKSIRPDHPIAICVGEEAAIKLAEWAGGSRLNICCVVGIQLSRRNTDILAASAQGQSKKSLAHQHKLTTRWIRIITITHF